MGTPCAVRTSPQIVGVSLRWGMPGSRAAAGAVCFFAGSEADRAGSSSSGSSAGRSKRIVASGYIPKLSSAMSSGKGGSAPILPSSDA